ncbi:ATP-binding protein [Streptomyces sp. NPDC050636]|uniref:ATP-binding protein n=1 Tax=Streptomyces sp. NPDC050636 TaxID=3154510 RepID=UPI00342637DD
MTVKGMVTVALNRRAATKNQPVVSRWTRHPRCVGLARAELRMLLDSWGLTVVSDAALVVLSELLTNAMRYARVSPDREIETRYFREADGVRIEVHDAARNWPQPRMPDIYGGRGLVVVAELADRWGVEVSDGNGKSVWAVVTAAGRGEA